MSIGVPVEVVNFGDTVDRTVYTIPSFTPPANSTLFLFVANGAGTAGNEVKPTSISGGTLGLTWTEVITDINTSDNLRGTLYRAVTGGSPPTGTVVINYSTTQSSCLAMIHALTGVDAASPVVQSMSAKSTTPDDPALTLAALQANSAVLGYIVKNNNVSYPAGAGLTLLTDSPNATSPTLSAAMEYDVTSPSTSVGWTTTANIEKVLFAVELRASASNIAPTANAGPDQTNVEAWSTVQLNGDGSDSDGTISTYSWNHISGPSTNASLNSTTGRFPTYEAPGTLAGATDVWRLTVTDNSGGTGTDDVSIQVMPSRERAAVGGVEVPAKWFYA